VRVLEVSFCCGVNRLVSGDRVVQIWLSTAISCAVS
jgi:hypothetical protein